MAWWVVLGHGLHLAGIENVFSPLVVKLIADGDVAVHVFVIVSGFVITHLLVVKKESYGRYLLRRAFRLYPIYLVCLVLAIATTDLYAAAYTGSAWNRFPVERTVRLVEQGSNFPEHLALHITMLHGAVPDSLLDFSSTSILPPAWSLSLEWQFYLLAPLIVAAFAFGARLALLASAVMLAAHLAAAWGLFGTWRQPAFLPLAIQYFVLGIVCRLALGENDRSRTPLPLLVAVGLGCLLLIGVREAAIWAVFYVFVLVEIGRIQSRPLKRLANWLALNSVVRRAGTWSYSTYLVHVPIFALVVGGAEAYLGISSQPASFALIALSLPLVLVASKLLYASVERPFIDYGRRLANRRSERGGPAAA